MSKNKKISTNEIYSIIQEEKENLRVEIEIRRAFLNEIRLMKEAGASREMINEQFLDWVGSALEKGLPGFVQSIKRDITWLIISRLGVSRTSLLGEILAKSFAEIDTADLKEILTPTAEGGRCEEFADAFSIGIAESLTTDLILDSVAEKFGIGRESILYQTIRESINIKVFQNEIALPIRERVIDAICGLSYEDIVELPVEEFLTGALGGARDIIGRAGTGLQDLFSGLR
jgi:hypothetical protein